MFFLFTFLLEIILTIRDCICAIVRNVAPIGLYSYKDISGKVVLITGAGGALGRELTKAFSKRGCNLVLWDIDEKGLRETAEACRGNGCTVKIYVVDMSRRVEISEVAADVRKEFGGVDIVINNAAVGYGGKLVERADEHIRMTMEVNAMSHFWLAKEFLPEMLERDSGHIVTIASMCSLIAPAQDMVPYCASKYAAFGIQEALENETTCMGKQRIRFTTVCPSFFRTRLSESMTTRPAVPIISVEYVAKCAVDAILTDQRIAIIPARNYVMYAFKGMLPRSTYHRLATRYFRNEP